MRFRESARAAPLHSRNPCGWMWLAAVRLTPPRAVTADQSLRLFVRTGNLREGFAKTVVYLLVMDGVKTSVNSL